MKDSRIIWKKYYWLYEGKKFRSLRHLKSDPVFKIIRNLSKKLCLAIDLDVKEACLREWRNENV